MVTPSNFFAPCNFASFDAAFGLVNECSNLPIKHITSANIGPTYLEIFSKFAPCMAKVVFRHTSGTEDIIGSGGWISSQLFITAAHVLFTKSAQTFIKTHDDELLNLNEKLLCLDSAMDIAIFNIEAPSFIKNFPELKSCSDSSIDVGMMHFGKNSQDLLVSVGSKSNSDLFELCPLSSIDGGPGSSGGFIFDTTGSLAYMQISALEHGYNVRSHVDASSILELLSHPKVSCAENKSLHESKEHGFLQTSFEVDNSRKSTLPPAIIKKSHFNEADAFIRQIIINDLFDFYSRAFGESGSLYKDGDLRLDVQNPTKTATNLQVQYGDYTLASVQIPYALSYFSESKPFHIPLIVTIAKYSLGQLLISLQYAKENYKTITCKVQQKDINTFNLVKLLNKTV